MLIFLMVTPVSAELNATSAGANMVKSGINSCIIGLADDLYNSGVGIFDTNVSNSSSTTAIFAIATYTYDPFENQGILNLQYISALIFLIMIIIYIFLGAAGIIVTRYIPALSTAVSFITKGGSYGSYIQNLATGMIVALFTYIFIKFILEMNYVVTHLIMVDVLEAVAPSVDNIVLYFMMAVCYFIMSIFFLWRMLIIGIVTSFALVFGVMLVFDSTRNIAKGIFSYFVSMVFMQSIICGATAAGIRIIQASNGSADSEMLRYLSLILLLVVIALLMCLGIHRVIWGAKKGIQVIAL